MLGWMESWLPVVPPRVERKIKLFYNGHGTVDLEDGSVVPVAGDLVWPQHEGLRICYEVSRVEHYMRTESCGLGYPRVTRVHETLITLNPVGER